MFALWYLGNDTTPGHVSLFTVDGDPMDREEELLPDDGGDDGLRRLGYRRDDDAKWTDEDDLADTYAAAVRPL